MLAIYTTDRVFSLAGEGESWLNLTVDASGCKLRNVATVISTVLEPHI
jgi:hypothetical protein